MRKRFLVARDDCQSSRVRRLLAGVPKTRSRRMAEWLAIVALFLILAAGILIGDELLAAFSR